jgi:hypothetical protein
LIERSHLGLDFAGCPHSAAASIDQSLDSSLEGLLRGCDPKRTRFTGSTREAAQSAKETPLVAG